MVQVKATDIVAARNLLWEQQKDDLLTAGLSSQAKEIFSTVLATTWVDSCWEEEILCAAAKVLFPETSQPLRELGRRVAEKNLRGIYRAFLRIPSPAFVINRAPLLWSLASKKEKLSVDMLDNHTARIVLSQYPDLPVYQMEYIAGYAEQMVELMGYAHARAKWFTNNPAGWVWELAWE